MDAMEDSINALTMRLTLVEEDLKHIAGMRKWIMTAVFAVIIQAGGFLWGYAQLSLTVTQLTGSDLPRDVSTALRVLADHGTEMENIRLEQARIRERVDIISDREYEETNKLEARIVRVETKVFN